MRKAHKQNGSAHVVVTVILAVALVGSLGFTFYQNFIAKKNIVAITDIAKTQVSNDSKTEATAKPANSESFDVSKWSTVQGPHYILAIPDGWKVERLDTDGYIVVTHQMDVDKHDALKYVAGKAATVKKTTLSGGRGINTNFFVTETLTSNMSQDYDSLMNAGGYTLTQDITKNGNPIEIYKKTYQQEEGGVEGGPYYKGTVQYLINIKRDNRVVNITYQIDPGQQDDYKYLLAALKIITIN